MGNPNLKAPASQDGPSAKRPRLTMAPSNSTNLPINRAPATKIGGVRRGSKGGTYMLLHRRHPGEVQVMALNASHWRRDATSTAPSPKAQPPTSSQATPYASTSPEPTVASLSTYRSTFYGEEDDFRPGNDPAKFPPGLKITANKVATLARGISSRDKTTGNKGRELTVNTRPTSPYIIIHNLDISFVMRNQFQYKNSGKELLPSRLTPLLALTPTRSPALRASADSGVGMYRSEELDRRSDHDSPTRYNRERSYSRACHSFQPASRDWDAPKDPNENSKRRYDAYADDEELNYDDCPAESRDSRPASEKKPVAQPRRERKFCSIPYKANNAMPNARGDRPSTISLPTFAASVDPQVRERDAHQYLADIEALALAEAPGRGYDKYCREALHGGLQKGLPMLWWWDWSQFYHDRDWDYYKSGFLRRFAVGESKILIPEGWGRSEAKGKSGANEEVRFKGSVAGESVLGTGVENSNEKARRSEHLHEQLTARDIDNQLTIRGHAARAATHPTRDNTQGNSPITAAGDIHICISPNEHLHSYITRAITLQSRCIEELKLCALERALQHIYPYRRQLALYIQLCDIGLLDESGNLDLHATFADVRQAVDLLIVDERREQVKQKVSSLRQALDESVNHYLQRCHALEEEIESDDQLWHFLQALPIMALGGLADEAVQFRTMLYLKIDGFLDEEGWLITGKANLGDIEERVRAANRLLGRRREVEWGLLERMRCDDRADLQPQS